MDCFYFSCNNTIDATLPRPFPQAGIVNKLPAMRFPRRDINLPDDALRALLRCDGRKLLHDFVEVGDHSTGQYSMRVDNTWTDRKYGC